MSKRNVIDTKGRVWRRYAIPDGVELANGESIEKIKEELRKEKKEQKERARKEREKAKRKAKIKREESRKEWENRPKIIYTPMGNKR